MTWLGYASLGYAASPTETLRIIHETGVFYLAISIAYLLSFLYMYFHSASVKKMKKPHIIGILMWGFIGATLILGPNHFTVFFNFFVLGLAIVILYQLHLTSPLAAQGTVMPPKLPSDNKKKMYTDNLLKRWGYTLNDIVSSTLINEHILWVLILYRAVITLRASTGV